MKRIALLKSFLLASAIFAVYSAPALAAGIEGQPYIILVGVNKYQDKQILPRKHAEQDAKALYDVFAAKEHLGVDAEHIKLLLGSPDAKRKSQQATRKNILAALKWAAKNAGKKDLVIVGFFGQGAPMGDRACYFAADSTYKDRAKDALASGDIEDVFSKLKSHRGVVFLDVDFTGFDPGKEPRPDPNLRGFYREFLGNDDAKAGFSRVVFLANNGLQPSLKLGKHGMFAKVLLDGLAGESDKFGYEPDGLITVDELAKYVRTELTALVRKHGKTDEVKKNQMPIILEGQSHNFVVDINPTAHKLVQKRLANFKKLAQVNKLAPAVAEEGQDLLSRMPKLEAKQTLRKVYQRFADDKLTAAAFSTERNKVLAGMKLPDRESLLYARLVIKASQRVLDEYVKDVNQGQIVAWAIEGMYTKIHEKIPSKIAMKIKNAKNLSQVDMLKTLIEARSHLGRREDLGQSKDITYSLHGMLVKLDRHTDYYDAETVRRILMDTRGNFSGIGVQIRRNNGKDALQVVTPLKGSPAYKAGMYTGDLIRTIIREVDSKGKTLPKPEIISTRGMSTEDAVKKILGTPGTKVKLIVDRPGAKKPLEFELIRGTVEIETVMGHKRKKDDNWDFIVDPENKICYVRLTQFSRNTRRDLAKVMKQLSKTGVKGFILDLRFNPGGLLDSAVKISDLYIDDGMIVTIRPRKGAETSYIGKSGGDYLTFPMVCLVNGYSASGSEIVSACLQDHGRAIVIGSRSYGKGSVQTIHPFNETGGLLKLTTATFWRPSNKNLNKSSTKGRAEDVWGVKPSRGFKLKLNQKELNQLQEFMRYNEIIPRPDVPREKSDIADFTDRQLNLALDYIRAQINMAARAETGSKGAVSNN